MKKLKNWLGKSDYRTNVASFAATMICYLIFVAIIALIALLLWNTIFKSNQVTFDQAFAAVFAIFGVFLIRDFLKALNYKLDRELKK